LDDELSYLKQLNLEAFEADIKIIDEENEDAMLDQMMDELKKFDMPYISELYEDLKDELDFDKSEFIKFVKYWHDIKYLSIHLSMLLRTGGENDKEHEMLIENNKTKLSSITNSYRQQLDKFFKKLKSQEQTMLVRGLNALLQKFKAGDPYPINVMSELHGELKAMLPKTHRRLVVGTLIGDTDQYNICFENWSKIRDTLDADYKKEKDDPESQLLIPFEIRSKMEIQATCYQLLFCHIEVADVVNADISADIKHIGGMYKAKKMTRGTRKPRLGMYEVVEEDKEGIFKDYDYTLEPKL